jgi:3-oxoacyl-[acyl-carrier protein] reductase
MGLEKQVVLITGASSGIGRASALAMARQGARVGVNYFKNQAGAEGVSKTIRKNGGEATTVYADVTRNADVRAMVEKIRKKWGRIDVLVNNAGDLLGPCPIAEMTEEFWRKVLDLNLTSAFLCVQAVWDEMASRKSGTIINITSIAGRHGGAANLAYSAAKGGLLTYTKGLAKELAPFGVRVNAVAPGVIATPFHERYTPPELFQQYIGKIPWGRAGTAEEVAEVVVFLASPSSGYMTGQTVDVNGGLWMS